MRKILCLLLIVMLLLPCSGGSEELSIAELMARQVSANSAFRFLLSAEAAGDAPFFLSEAVWTGLQRLTETTVLEGSYVLSKAGDTLGNAQLCLQLKQGDAVRSEMMLTGRDTAFVLSGDAVATPLALPRETDILRREKNIPLSAWLSAILRNIGLPGTGTDTGRAWPSLRSFLTRATTETAAWKAQVDEALAPYRDDLSAWLQSRTQLGLVKLPGGKLGTVSTVRADFSACAAQIDVLLTRFYSDSVLRGLFRPVMTEEEAQAYLEEGMLPLFREMLAGLSGTQEMLLERRYNAEGEMSAFTLTLPFADGSTCMLARAEEVSTLQLTHGDQRLTLTAAGDAATGCTGTFAFTAPNKQLSGTYQLFASLSKVTRNAANVGRERQQEGMLTLLLSPDAGMPFPAQSLTVQLTASAGAADTQAAHWNAVLSWRDLSAAASSLTLTLKTRTAAAIGQKEAPAPVLSLPQLDAAARTAYAQGVLSALLQALLPDTP